MEKNRHKFMVQSMFAPDGEINQETLVLFSLPPSLPTRGRITLPFFAVEGNRPWPTDGFEAEMRLRHARARR